MLKLHIGCGRTYINKMVNVDINPDVGADIVWDITSAETPPWPENSVDEMLMSHVLEHISNPLKAMENLWHIAAPGCRLVVFVPYGSSDNAWEDPTHVRPYFLDSCGYFSQAAYGGADYGYRGDWMIKERALKLRPHWNPAQFEGDYATMLEVINTHRNTVDEMCFVFEAVKPARKPGTFREAAPITFILPDTQPKGE